MAKTDKKNARKKKVTTLGEQAARMAKLAREARTKAERSGMLDDLQAATAAEDKAVTASKAHRRETFLRVGNRYMNLIGEGMRKLGKLAESPKVHYDGGDVQYLTTFLTARQSQLFTKFNEGEKIRREGLDQTRFQFPPLAGTGE